MRKIDKPEFAIKEVCDAMPCLKYSERVIEKTNNYDKYIKELRPLYEDEKNYISLDNEYKDHMKKMYSERFSNKQYDVYRFYKGIRNSQKSCPYCNIFSHRITQVDHYLPKSKFPSLAISPENLVPICTDCNDEKSNYYSLNRNEMLIHPYLDDFISNPFDYIKCEIIESIPIGFRIYIDKLENWNECQYNRVRFHFKKLHLDEIYRTYFEEEFQAYIYEIEELVMENDIEQLKKNIMRRVNSYKRSNTSPWLYAGFDSLQKSEWFFNIYLKSVFHSS